MKAKENLATTNSAATLAAKIRRKEVSAVEVMDAAIARIETHNSKSMRSSSCSWKKRGSRRRRLKPQSCAATSSGLFSVCRLP